MTGPSLDLAALRRYLDALESGLNLTVQIRSVDGRILDLAIAETRAALALVEEQRKEIERLREAVCKVDGFPCHCALDDALAGFPAENKERTPVYYLGGYPELNKKPVSPLFDRTKLRLAIDSLADLPAPFHEVSTGKPHRDCIVTETRKMFDSYEDLVKKLELARRSLKMILETPHPYRNPDGVDQFAEHVKSICEDTLEVL